MLDFLKQILKEFKVMNKLDTYKDIIVQFENWSINNEKRNEMKLVKLS